MNNRFKKLTVELSGELREKCIEFMAKKFSGEENTTDIMNLILSANISNLADLMLRISSEHPKIHEKVKEFIKKLYDVIPTIIEGGSIEIIEGEK